MPVLEAQYKMVTRTAQLICKEIPQEEVNEMLATMSGIKGQLSKVFFSLSSYAILMGCAKKLSDRF